jgi:hypothetical protein
MPFLEKMKNMLRGNKPPAEVYDDRSNQVITGMDRSLRDDINIIDINQSDFNVDVDKLRPIKSWRDLKIGVKYLFSIGENGRQVFVGDGKYGRNNNDNLDMIGEILYIDGKLEEIKIQRLYIRIPHGKQWPRERNRNNWTNNVERDEDFINEEHYKMRDDIDINDPKYHQWYKSGPVHGGPGSFLYPRPIFETWISVKNINDPNLLRIFSLGPNQEFISEDVSPDQATIRIKQKVQEINKSLQNSSSGGANKSRKSRKSKKSKKSRKSRKSRK